MGITNTKRSKEYENYLNSMTMVRQEYSPEFSLEMGIFKRENSLDPSELVLVCEQLYDDEGDPRYKDKQNKIMQRKVNSIYDTSGYRILNVC